MPIKEIYLKPNVFLYLLILSPECAPAQTIFTEVTDSLNPTHQRCSVGAAWGDYDGDGYLDLYVVNLGQSNVLYKNSGSGHLIDVAQSAGVDDSGDGVGCAWADFDNDGDLDLFVSNRPGPNRFYRNNGDGTFTDIAETCGMVDPVGNGEGVSWADYNNDGWLDLYVANHAGEDNLYMNNCEGTFTDVTSQVGITNPANSRGCVWGDYDNDGDLDLFIANHDYQLNKLYRNECGPNHWLIVKIKGTISNSSGIGARLVVKVESLSMTREVSGGSGFASQNSLPLEFGLGSFPSVDTISVKWPSGISQSLVCLEGDTIITITEEIIGIYDTKHPLSEANPTYRIFPNPFTSKTTIFYLVSNYFHVSLSIYDLSGNLVRMLLDSPRPVGSYSINWDGTDERDREIPSGIYFIKNSSDQKIKVIKLR